MNWKQHIIAGLVATSIVCFIFIYNKTNLQFITYIFFYLTSIVYSLLPDIDSPISKAREFATIFLLSIALYFVILQRTNFAIGTLSALILIWSLNSIKGFGHRGMLHSVQWGILLSIPLLFIDWRYCVIALSNYLTHFVMDGLIK